MDKKENRMAKKALSNAETATDSSKNLTFFDSFIEELNQILLSELLIIKELPKMNEEVASKDLKEILEILLKETEGQVQRLERVFDHLNREKAGRNARGMEGLFKEGKESIAAHEKSAIKDALIIAAMQKIVHYGIAAYGSTKAHAECLKLNNIQELLEASLKEKTISDTKLTSMAEGTLFSMGVNQRAVQEDLPQ